jgi:hypothetical protein
MGDTPPLDCIASPHCARIADAVVGDRLHGPARAVHRRSSGRPDARFSMTQLCARYGISRKTGYKWPARYAEKGRRRLTDRSRAPHHCPHRIADAVADLICQARVAHLDWGADSSSTGSRRGTRSSTRGRRSVPPLTCSQGPIPHGRRGLPLSAHHRRSAHAGSRQLPRPALDPNRDGAAGVRAGLPRVWAAAGDPHRQRCAVRHAGDPRAFLSERLVDAARHSVPTPPARSSTEKRGPRADASHTQAPRDSAGPGDVPRPAADLRCVPWGVQH